MANTSSWRFTVEPGYFASLHDLAASSPIGRVTTQPRFGLLARDYPSDGDQVDDDHDDHDDERDWVRFARHVKALNAASPANVHYKVLYLTRHGFGFHNKKEKEVGTPEWDRYWSLLDGADGETWFDSLLTPEGVEQARELGELWLQAVHADGAPLPASIYTSPLSRCLQTCHYSLSPVVASRGLGFHPVVREKLRERMTMHTCDKRRPRSWIRENWPAYRIGEDVTEEDVLGNQGREETVPENIAREQRELEELFDMDQGEFLSLTMHSGAISALLMACGLEPPGLREGTTIAVLLRGERLSE